MKKTPAFKVRGKFMFRLREDNESLTDPDKFFVTDHYRGYPAVLVHLKRVTLPVLREVVEQTWRFNAPRTLVKQFDTP